MRGLEVCSSDHCEGSSRHRLSWAIFCNEPVHLGDGPLSVHNLWSNIVLTCLSNSALLQLNRVQEMSLQQARIFIVPGGLSPLSLAFGKTGVFLYK